MQQSKFKDHCMCTCGAATKERSPPPAVVFHCQLEVGQGDGDEGCDNDKDDEDDEEDGVDGVHLVAPHAGKDVVQLNIDGTERQEPCNTAIAFGSATVDPTSLKPVTGTKLTWPYVSSVDCHTLTSHTYSLWPVDDLFLL